MATLNINPNLSKVTRCHSDEKFIKPHACHDPSAKKAIWHRRFRCCGVIPADDGWST